MAQRQWDSGAWYARRKIVDDDLLIVFNASEEDLTFTVPQSQLVQPWQLSFSTAELFGSATSLKPGDTFDVPQRSVQIFVRSLAPEAQADIARVAAKTSALPFSSTTVAESVSDSQTFPQ